jgi:hypothetical protein
VEQGSPQGSQFRTSQTSVSAALAAANAALRFPDDDGNRSLVEMAQRDLDAALQLLADRAQYITGSSGAAIALRRGGKNDMLCRASTGSNAPELGALLSTELGLSGESVRTRRTLRCDDAARDARVNREVCRQLGIASVVVMPVVHDDEVLGVFELFSGKASAFGERDLSALQRLSEMVETAVGLARAVEGIPERLKKEVPSVSETSGAETTTEASTAILETAGPLSEFEAAVAVEPPAELQKRAVLLDVPAQLHQEIDQHQEIRKEVHEKDVDVEILEVTETRVAETLAKIESAKSEPAQSEPAKFEPTKKPLFWSAAMNLSADTANPVGPVQGPDQSHVPPVFRNLRKCEACGFPVSAGRALCVECEEKKWRGQLKMPRTTALRSSSGAAAAAAPAPVPDLPKPTLSKPAEAASALPAHTAQAKNSIESKAVTPQAPLPSANLPKVDLSKADLSAAQLTPETAPASSPAPIFSAGLEPSQSWLARNKYVLGALLAVAGTIAAILLLR